MFHGAYSTLLLCTSAEIKDDRSPALQSRTSRASQESELAARCKVFLRIMKKPETVPLGGSRCLSREVNSAVVIRGEAGVRSYYDFMISESVIYLAIDSCWLTFPVWTNCSRCPCWLISSSPHHAMEDVIMLARKKIVWDGDRTP